MIIPFEDLIEDQLDVLSRIPRELATANTIGCSGTAKADPANILGGTCATCGQFVPSSTIHLCPGHLSQEYPIARIANALERIANALEKLAE